MAGRLLIYAPVPLAMIDGVLHLEDQACDGLRLWAANFDHVTAIMPLTTALPGPSWVPLSARPGLERVSLEPVPMAYRPDRFLLHLSATRRRIAALIEDADYLSFAIGGLFGDWGAVACFEAHRMKRPYAVWTDRVESRVMREAGTAGSWRSRLRAALTWRPAAMLERAVIRRAGLGLFHGRETFDVYAPYCANPAVVHDIHVDAADHISSLELEAKKSATKDRPLRIVYAGRAESMKGPMDWIDVLARLRDDGVDFRATWIGDGSMQAAMRARIENCGLSGRVDMPGPAPHDDVLRAFRKADVLLFCHKTPESPRCLIEALISGCPIVGYDSAFPRDLIAAHGGGSLSPKDDVAALARTVARLAGDRAELAQLIDRAARDGAPFTDVAVFRHRSDLIKAHLAPSRDAAVQRVQLRCA